ncbi:Leucine zipper transcription factor-like protein 1 [Chamberlinius hualienensis]
MASESEIGLGLNDHHQRNLWNYMRFARYIRTQNVRTIDSCFHEVRDIIDDILNIVKIDIEAEWINMTHTNAVLLKQLFVQAEKWHLKLLVDTSELENIDLLQEVKEFEDHQMTSSNKDRTVQESLTNFHLEPLNDTGCAALLQKEIETLQEENLKLKERLKMIESQASIAFNERNKLSEELRQLKMELETSSVDSSQQVDLEVSSLTQELSQAKIQLEDLQNSVSKNDDLEVNLTSVTHQLLQVQAMLERKEKDLETKFSQTSAFVNLKKMLHQKNQLVKSLRNRLSKYEPDDMEGSEENED